MASDDLSIPPEVRREVRRASVKAAGEVIAEAVSAGMTDALASALVARLGAEGPWILYSDGNVLNLAPDSLLGDFDRYREHSVKLNSVMWALWQAWHPELAREDHCDVDVDAVLDQTLNAVIATRGERAAIISHALRQCQLFDGPGSCADYDEAAAIVAALGFPLEGHVNGGTGERLAPCSFCGFVVVTDEFGHSTHLDESASGCRTPTPG